LNPFTHHQLSNGLSIVIEKMPGVRSAAVGILCRTGARDESPQLAGVSHFLEHMCFKGTPNRSAEKLNHDFDALGGQHNAFTSQDRTFYHCTARLADVDRQIEILADMMQSTVPPDEFDMEKNVVLEEIAMSDDRIESVAFDTVLETGFKGHSLSWPVLGYKRTLEPLTRDQMHDYFRSRYVPDNMILVVTGDVDPDAVIKAADKHCGTWQPGAGKLPERQAPKFHTGTVHKKMDRFQQQIVTICFPAPPAVDPLHETAQAVASLLGGHNSRFHWNIEQKGLSPHAGAYRLDYKDCALLILMAPCDPANTDALIEALRTEAQNMARDSVTDAEIQRVKNRRRTSLAVEGEAPHYRLLQVMDDADYRQQPRTVSERLAAVDAIDKASIQRYFEQYPVDDGLLVTVGPRNGT